MPPFAHPRRGVTGRRGKEFLAGTADRSSIVRRQKGRLVKNPLDSIYGTVIAGAVLTVIFYFVVKALQPVGA
jgi:hypothetical protein